MGIRTRVKVCCIADRAEARAAIDLGADALGLVAAMPSGPGSIPDDTIAEIAGSVPPGVDTFLLTRRTDPVAILEHVNRCRTSVVQLVAPVEASVYLHLRREARGLRIVQVVHVENEESRLEAERVSRHVDALLLDSGRPSATVPELGGTGRVHDWTVSRAIVAAVDVPVFLAGGLGPHNVADAVRAVHPYGVDLCSGVRSEGRLDLAKLHAFMQEVRSVDEDRPSAR